MQKRANCCSMFVLDCLFVVLIFFSPRTFWSEGQFLAPLTVHTLPQTHLKTLDTFVNSFAKKWAGVPRSATNAIIHSEQGLDIPSISTLYTEAHIVRRTMSSMPGRDFKVIILSTRFSTMLLRENWPTQNLLAPTCRQSRSSSPPSEQMCQPCQEVNSLRRWGVRHLEVHDQC